MTTGRGPARAVLAAAAALSLAACGASQATQPKAPPATSQPPAASAPAVAPDGVAILHQAGVTNASNGGTDLWGDAMANGTVHQGSCTGGCGELLTVYSNADAAALAAHVAQFTLGSQALVKSDDGLFVITVTGVIDTSADPAHNIVYYITPAQVAQRVHGTVAVPGAASS